MSALREVLEQLLDRRNLSEAQASDLLVALTDPTLSPAMGGALLAGLRAKGVTADEVRGFAKTMRKLARRPILPDGGPLVDMVGTGGDGSGSFNLSTGAALLVAAMGIRVAKHGTSSVSSRSGSADVIRALGLNLPLDEKAAGECLAATGFTFFFAPHYHPAMKAVMPIRQALGVRTVFNILGPLSNPAEPQFHLIGAYHVDIAALMAETLAGMPIERAYVVHGEPGWDEATPIGPFTLFDVRPGKVTRATAQCGGIRAASLHRRGAEGRRRRLQCGTSARGAGRARPRRPSQCDRAAGGAGAGIDGQSRVAARCRKDGAGRHRQRRRPQDPGTNCRLRSARNSFSANRQPLTANRFPSYVRTTDRDGAVEPGEARTGARARIRTGVVGARMRRAAAPQLKLSPEGFDIIAECKLASPSAGDLSAHTIDVDRRVQAYAHGGACAVSVLTEPTRFGGSLEHLAQTARTLAPLSVPVMRKDFLVDPYQVMEARAAGAGGVLVIVRMLDRSRITALLDCAAMLKMFVLIEAFDAADLQIAQEVLAARKAHDEQMLVGVNCRDLDTLSVELSRLSELASSCRRTSPRWRKAASARWKTSRQSSMSATKSRWSARR